MFFHGNPGTGKWSTAIKTILVIALVLSVFACALEPEQDITTDDTVITPPKLSDDFTVTDGYVMLQSFDYFYVNSMRYTQSPLALPLTIDNPYATDNEIRVTTSTGIQFWIAIQPYGSYTIATDNPMLLYGYVIRRSNDDFVIQVNPGIYGSGYNVVPREVDPWNAYDIEDIRTYVGLYPAMVISGYDD